jgi:hypothetical protein
LSLWGDDSISTLSLLLASAGISIGIGVALYECGAVGNIIIKRLEKEQLKNEKHTWGPK